MRALLRRLRKQLTPAALLGANVGRAADVAEVVAAFAGDVVAPLLELYHVPGRTQLGV